MVALVALLLLGMLASAAAGWLAYAQLGHTPGRLMDYVERRLQGHPKLELVALPVIGWVRQALDEPAAPVRLAEPFVVPPPPPRWGPAEAARDGGGPGGSAARTAGAAPGEGRLIQVGPTRTVRTVAEAARLARDGDTVEIDAGDYFGDVAVWLQKRLTIRGVGGNARLHAAGRSAEGKAIWVIRDGSFLVENVDFIGAKVRDRNGAGIRFENGHLVVRNCLFWDSEAGVLTSSGPQHRGARLEIEASEFGYLGDGVGQSHHVYVGDITHFRISGSYLHHGNVGHLVKSRAAFTEILHNRLTDESGGRASYEIDLPSGGVAVVVGNVVQQVRRTENSAMVSFGREGLIWPESRLFMAHNTFVNEHPHGGAYLRTADGVDEVVSLNNLYVGPGRLHVPDGRLRTAGDARGDWTLFHLAARQDYRLSAAGRALRAVAPAPAAVRGTSLVPAFDYEHPRRLRRLEGPPASPGAIQAAAP